MRGLSVLDAASLDRVSIPWLTETTTTPRGWGDLQRGKSNNTYGDSEVEPDSVTVSVDSDSAPFQRLIALMRLCLESDPAKRPDSRAVSQQLLEIEAILVASRAMSES